MSGVPAVKGVDGAVEVILCRRRDGRVGIVGAIGGGAAAVRGLRAITWEVRGKGLARNLRPSYPIKDTCTRFRRSSYSRRWRKGRSDLL